MKHSRLTFEETGRKSMAFKQSIQGKTEEEMLVIFKDLASTYENMEEREIFISKEVRKTHNPVGYEYVAQMNILMEELNIQHGRPYKLKCCDEFGCQTNYKLVIRNSEEDVPYGHFLCERHQAQNIG